MTVYLLSNHRQELRYSWAVDLDATGVGYYTNLRNSRAQLVVGQRRDLPTTIRVRIFCGGLVRELMGAAEGAAEDYWRAKELWHNDQDLEREG